MTHRTLRVLALTVLFAAWVPLAAGPAPRRTGPESPKARRSSGPTLTPTPTPCRSSPAPAMWGQGLRLYPYFFYNRFSAAAVDKAWTVVRLENPYIRVAVLPEVGGKVWGAADKLSGRDFLYTNHVLKFREIALRGPWTSGGIEFNFGIVGHAPSTASPVDYILRRNADGSATCVVGAMDLPSRTRWSVTITLPKDKAYFETQRLLAQSHGATANPIITGPARPSRRPTTSATSSPAGSRSGMITRSPSSPGPSSRQGVDLSWYKNNASPGSKSYFTVGEHEDFYGAWYKNADAGFGHWAPLRRHARPQGLDLGPVAAGRDLGRPPHGQGRPVHGAPGRPAPQPVGPRPALPVRHATAGGRSGSRIRASDP